MKPILLLIGVIAITLGLGLLFGSGLADQVLHFTGGPGQLSGHVVDYCSGIPIQGATVTATLRNTGSVTTDQTDATGDYALSIPYTTWYDLRATKTGYTTATIIEIYLRGFVSETQDFALMPSGFTECPAEPPPPPGTLPSPPPGGIPGSGTATNETDFDQDGTADGSDNCAVTYNPDQADADVDGIGDACDESSPIGLIAFGILLIVIVLGAVLVILGLWDR